MPQGRLTGDVSVARCIHREALGHLLFGIREGSGFVAVTGEIGTGKTTLLRTLLLDLEPFPLTNNVTIHWVGGSPEARLDMERELQTALRDVYSGENGAGGWFLGIGATLFLVIMALTAAFIVFVLMRGRR